MSLKGQALWRITSYIRPEKVASRHPKDHWIMADPFPMSRYTKQALKGLVRAMCPTELPDFEDEVVDQVRRMMQFMLPMTSGALFAAFHLLDLAPLASSYKKTLHELTAEEGAVFLHNFEHGPIPLGNMMVFGVRALILSSYFDREAFHDQIGYAPTPFMNQRIALRHRLKAGASPSKKDNLPVEIE